MSNSSRGTVDVVVKATTLALLTLAMLGIHQFALPPSGFEVRGLFALGYIILAAYTVGELAEVIKLPHITGYLLAGLALGPSVASLLVGAALPPPLDEGILNQQVINQLVLLDSLALALIALTAGGELKLGELQSGLKVITGILVGQGAVMVVGVVLFFVVALAVAPTLLPPVAAAGTATIVALAVVVASVSFATSPAATIAVINSTGAKGPVARTVLSAVVLKDVLVVIAFSASMAVAASVMQLGTEGGFGLALWHITQSVFLGIAVGGLLHLYLRFIGAELLLFLVGMIYTTTFVAEAIHAEAALVFIVAGVVVSNFSDRGETLIHEVERLSMPVYVVFFTLAGAKLHLDELWTMLPLALGLVVVRAASLVIGVKAGVVATGGSKALGKYGWMGFVSQAGLAITLATQMKETFPDGVGEALFSVILGGVAINEMVGPVLLQMGLGLAGEVRGDKPAAEEAETPQPAREASAPSDLHPDDPFGPASDSGVPALDRSLGALQDDLQILVREETWGPLMEMARDGDAWLRLLRRDLLRVQRAADADVTHLEDPALLATALRNHIGALGGRWGSHVLNIAARVRRKDRWSPLAVVDGIDAHVKGIEVLITAPIHPSRLPPRDENPIRSTRRWLLGISASLGGNRNIYLRDLAHYRLCDELPLRLEGLAALMVDAELHLAQQVEGLFEDLAAGWEEAAHAVDEGAPKDDVRAILQAGRSYSDGAFQELGEQLDSVAKEGVARSSAIVGAGMRRLKEDTLIIGTFELPQRRRRLGRVRRIRNQGLDALGPRLVESRQLVSARYAQLGLELELVSLEGHIRDAVHVHGSRLARTVRGRGPKQLQLVSDAVQEWLDAADAILDGPTVAAPLAKVLRSGSEPLVRRLQEARKAVDQLLSELSDETWLRPLLDQLHDQAQELTPYFEVPSTAPAAGAWTLPPAVPTTEIPFQELAVGIIEVAVTRSLMDLTGELAIQVQEQATMLEELERVVAFNTDLALSELDLVEGDAPLTTNTKELLRAMVVGAIGRSLLRLRELSTTATADANAVQSRIHGAVLERFQSLHQQILDGNIENLRQDTLRQASALGFAARAGQWAGLLPEVRTAVTSGLERAVGIDRIRRLANTLGLPSPSPQVSFRQAVAAPEAAVGLPIFYQRLFADHALEGSDLLSGRQEALATVRRVLVEPERRLRSVAMISIDAHASRALVNTALRTFQGTVVRLEPGHPWSVADLNTWLRSIPHHDACVVVDGLEWLFQRSPNGAAPLERLCRAIVADAGKRAWVLHADPTLWKHIAQTTPIGDAAGEVALMGSLEIDDLENAVLARHAMSGYIATFGTDKQLPLLSRFLGRKNRERRRQDEWFQLLHEASAGVLQDALRLWLQAIDRVDEQAGTLHLTNIRTPPVAQLAALPEDTLLTLLQVLRQGWLDATQHAWLFRLETGASEAHLAQLVHQGLLEEKGPRVQLPAHLRGPLERALQQRGWV